jgi:HEAT repeat protein
MPRIHPIFGIVAVPLLACIVLLLQNSRESAIAAGALSNDMRMSKLTDDLNDQDPTVRHNAVEALATLGKPAVSPLITILESSDSDVKQNAAEQALGRIGEPSVEPLIGLLDASNSDIRQRAIKALGSVGCLCCDEFAGQFRK